MFTKTTKIFAITALLGTTMLGLTACSGSEEAKPKPTNTSEQRPAGPIPAPEDANDISTTVDTQTDNNYIVGPITGSVEAIIKAKKVRIPNQGELYIFPIDPSEIENWTATSSDEKIAVFIKGTNGQPNGAGAIPPTFKATGVGTSNIEMTNNVTGEKVNFVIIGEPIF